ncbi:MAG TPA: FkbM family methyltransferase [Acetobacteraceae bacterium]|jgi:FkbM family methyltransferase|nr:FkbM family methyltransferase [Acetobacteraceae bacterium]
MKSWLSKGVRDALNSQFGRHGYPLRWIPPRVLCRPGQTVEVDFSLLAAHLMLTTKRPYFIGIGANDGVTHDPLFPFIRDFGWHGIMVEPIPEAFEALERNFAGFADVTLVQAAIGLSDGQGTIYSVDMSDEGSAMMSLHSSFNREIIMRGRQWHSNIEAHIIERQVPLMSFSTLLTKTNGRPVDVLKIDTEGYDLEILKSVDLPSLSPKLILAEHANLSKHDKIAMADILLDNGYRVAITSLDMLGYKAPPRAAA